MTTATVTECKVCAARDADDYVMVLMALQRLGMHPEAQQMTRELQRHFPNDPRFRDHQRISA
jgi:hypothetical protein